LIVRLLEFVFSILTTVWKLAEELKYGFMIIMNHAIP